MAPSGPGAEPLRLTSQVVSARSVPEIAPPPPPIRADPAPRPLVDQVAVRRPEPKARARMVQQRVASPAPAPTKAPARPIQPRASRSAFAEVKAGETLDDVAERVYGTRSATGILLRANRDQVRTSDGPLVAGTWLRTP